jgi:arginyl-tRNA synthetase
MGYTDQADRYTHFSYEMVALTPRCAVELGYDISEEDLKRPYIEVSGRKGFGVKADDLIDKLIAATRAEVDARQTGGASRSRARAHRRADRHRRAALLHAQVHAQLGHRLRLQGRAEL